MTSTTGARVMSTFTARHSCRRRRRRRAPPRAGVRGVPDRLRARDGREVRLAEPRDAPALLIDHHEQFRGDTRRFISAHKRDLRRGLHVPREEDHRPAPEIEHARSARSPRARRTRNTPAARRARAHHPGGIATRPAESRRALFAERPPRARKSDLTRKVAPKTTGTEISKRSPQAVIVCETTKRELAVRCEGDESPVRLRLPRRGHSVGHSAPAREVTRAATAPARTMAHALVRPPSTRPPSVARSSLATRTTVPLLACPATVGVVSLPRAPLTHPPLTTRSRRRPWSGRTASAARSTRW